MGVSGCGKSTIGELLSNELSLPFYDADNFHPESNVDKMSRGEALNDMDRNPWLNHLSEKITEWNQSGGAILACSALKEKYRDLLRQNTGDGSADNSGQVNESVIFVYLKGTKDLIKKRLFDRKGHYMPPELLDSQFNDLEEPSDALTIHIDKVPAEIVNEIQSQLSKFTENISDH
tara:strand:- start:18486 stop:19013 length:528 start_codon:yes stop_codon:yes gene_type:complete